MIELTPAAQQQIESILRDSGESGLRVFVEGGGCSGLNYGFNIESGPADDDWVLDLGSLRLWVDPFSMQYLESATIDYKQTLMQSSFVIANPNATATCGCGSSFAA